MDSPNWTNNVENTNPSKAGTGGPLYPSYICFWKFISGGLFTHAPARCQGERCDGQKKIIKSSI